MKTDIRWCLKETINNFEMIMNDVKKDLATEKSFHWFSKVKTPGGKDGKYKQDNKAIAKKLEQDWKNSLGRIKILLLGAGGSGKSTIFKQIQEIHNLSNLISGLPCDNNNNNLVSSQFSSQNHDYDENKSFAFDSGPPCDMDDIFRYIVCDVADL